MEWPSQCARRRSVRLVRFRRDVLRRRSGRHQEGPAAAEGARRRLHRGAVPDNGRSRSEISETHWRPQSSRYATDQEVQEFAQLVKDQGANALPRALEKEDNGRINAVGSTANQIAIARKRQQRSDTIIRARNMPSLGSIAVDAQPTARFGYLQVKLDANGKGGGQIMAAAKIRFDKTG